MSEYRPSGGFQMLPPVIKNLLIINGLVYAAANFTGPAIHDFFYNNFALFHWDSPFFKPWQFITHIFMHAPFNSQTGIFHILMNMFTLWMFGTLVENAIGLKRFIILYFVCGVGAALCHLGVFHLENIDSINWYKSIGAQNQSLVINHILNTGMGDPRAFPMFTPMVGASGAIFGVMFAMGYLFPNVEIYFNMFFPLKAKYIVAIYAVAELLRGIGNDPTDNVAHFAHLGGMLFAFLLLKMWKMSSKNMYRY